MTHAVPHPIEILYGGGVALACDLEGNLAAQELHGLYAGDTRVLSTYRYTIGGHGWNVLARTRPDPSSAQWDMTNPPLRLPDLDIDADMLHFRLRRRLVGAMHDDLELTSYASRAITVRLALQLDGDFADIFQVREGELPPHLGVHRITSGNRVSLTYERRGFRRALHVTFTPPSGEPTHSGALVLFDITLEPHRSWKCCVELAPDVDGVRARFDGDPHVADVPLPDRPPVLVTDPRVRDTFERSQIDLERLAMRDLGEPAYVAAGAPWFLTLFGRDTLVTALMGTALGSWHARGALAANARYQAHEVDARRDAQPGKIAHELRRGELAYRGDIPHTPYYATHDAPALYALALWNTWRWTGDDSLLDRYLVTAERALAWCARDGDRDGDGLLEYERMTPRGYYNQSWKDAGDAIVHEDGELAKLPIATVEMQAYWYAARLAMAELLEARGRDGRLLRDEAEALRARIEERFWLDDEGTYALALDGDKRVVRSIASNAGHVLWCGAAAPERARRVAARLLTDDMFSGWGVRTMTARHRRYNPMSYQLGSVWPHDNALLAAGLARYGLHDEAGRVLDALFAAASSFERNRLPELFCGLPRGLAGPVPYERANSPQAWAAAAPVLAVQLFLGLVPDVPRGKLHLSPWLPPWLPSLEVRGIEIGGGALDVRITARGLESASHPTLTIEQGSPISPLWGMPIVS